MRIWVRVVGGGMGILGFLLVGEGGGEIEPMFGGDDVLNWMVKLISV